MKTAGIHILSQLVYLDPPARFGVPTVGAMADYYTDDPAGQEALRLRFENIPAELAAWRAMLSSLPAELRALRVADILDDNAREGTGFYGCAFVSPDERERIVSFRGSELLGNPRFKNDYVTDFSLIFCDKTPQHRVVDLYWSKYADSSPKGGRVWVTGHSLGGNLAAYAAMAAPPQIREKLAGALCFNAPGFCHAFLHRYRASLQELGKLLISYQNRYDLVSSILDDPVPPFIAASAYDPHKQKNAPVTEIFYPHSNFVYAWDEKGELVPERGREKSALCRSVRLLTLLISRLPLPVREELTHDLLAAIYAGDGKASATERVLAAATNCLSRHAAKEPPGGPVSGLAAAAYAARLFHTAGIRHEYGAPAADDGASPPSLAKTAFLLIELMTRRITRHSQST